MEKTEKVGWLLLALSSLYFGFQVARGCYDYLKVKKEEEKVIKEENKGKDYDFSKFHTFNGFSVETFLNFYFMEKARENLKNNYEKIAFDVDLARENMEKNGAKKVLENINLKSLLEAMVIVESGGRNNEKSKKNAKGIAQLSDAVIKKYNIDPYNVKEAIKVCEKEISRLIGKYHNIPLALIAYNWGEGNVNKLLKKYEKRKIELEKIPYRIPRQTHAYVIKVLSRYYHICELQSKSLEEAFE
jgi:hypothetical protein